MCTIFKICFLHFWCICTLRNLRVVQILLMKIVSIRSMNGSPFESLKNRSEDFRKSKRGRKYELIKIYFSLRKSSTNSSLLTYKFESKITNVLMRGQKKRINPSLYMFLPQDLSWNNNKTSFTKITNGAHCYIRFD